MAKINSIEVSWKYSVDTDEPNNFEIKFITIKFSGNDLVGNIRKGDSYWINQAVECFYNKYSFYPDKKDVCVVKL